MEVKAPDQKAAVYAVFSGGGIKAAAFVGALHEAANRVRLIGVGGASAGSIVAALIACGYTNQEIEDLLFEAPYADFFRRRWLRFMLDQRRGLIDPSALLDWLQARIQKKLGKGRGKFSDLSDQQPILKIVTTNVSKREIKIFSKSQTPDEDIAHAVLASCSFPVLFPPVQHSGSDLVDGGVMSNFPMWLFDDERRAPAKEQASLLGFALVQDPQHAPVKASFTSHLYSVFESMSIAQDQVQEKYLEVERAANVIRIQIAPTDTFDTTQTSVKRNDLVQAGRRAARDYFDKMRHGDGRPIKFKSGSMPQARECVASRHWVGALSYVSRQHILEGGVAKDEGLGGRRALVKYYIDLMGAVTDPGKLGLLATILAGRITELGMSFDAVIGLKKGNLLLAAKTAELCGKPLSVLKTDMSYKVGAPFDGQIHSGMTVLIVDDIASDASMLVHAVQQVLMQRSRVSHVLTLIERGEGDAAEKLRPFNCSLISICGADDDAIRDLIELETHLPPHVDPANHFMQASEQ